MSDKPTDKESTQPDNRTGTRRFLDWVWDIVRTWAPALLVVLFIRSFVAEPFRIPSGSMVPTLEIGDHILVTKYSYGWRIPLTRIMLGEPDLPERGDVVVFVKPGTDGGSYFDEEGNPFEPHVNELGMMVPESGRTSRGLSYYLDLPFPPIATLDYVKRVIGLPGDIVEVRNEYRNLANGSRSAQTTVTINGVEQRQELVDASASYVDHRCTRYSVEERIEILRVGDEEPRPHRILRSRGYPLASESDELVSNQYGPYTVPEGHVFVMGDNRDNSFDSREWGFVPLRNIKGRARMVWLSYDKCMTGLPLIGSLRGERAGEAIE